MLAQRNSAKWSLTSEAISTSSSTQIKIAEAHAAGQPLYGPGGLIPAYNLSWGLRTVDGSLQPPASRPGTVGRGRGTVPELVDPTFGPAENIPPPLRPSRPTDADLIQSVEQSQLARFRFTASHHFQPAGRSDPGQSGRDSDCAGARRLRRSDGRSAGCDGNLCGLQAGVSTPSTRPAS